MQLADVYRKVKSLADNDQSIQNTTINDWIDDCINDINQMCKANFPLTAGQPTTYVPAFDSRYHEILVNFSVMKYREGDSDYTASQYFAKKFQDQMVSIERDMFIPPSLKLSEEYMQLVATANQQTYSLSIPYGAYFNPIFVYQNDNDISDYCVFDVKLKQMQIDLTQVIIAANDKITLKIENNSELNLPPVQWWGNAGW